MKHTPESIRADFEHYYSEGGRWARAVQRSASGEYKLMQAAVAWNTWQAAAAVYTKQTMEHDK